MITHAEHASTISVCMTVIVMLSFVAEMKNQTTTLYQHFWMIPVMNGVRKNEISRLGHQQRICTSVH